YGYRRAVFVRRAHAAVDAALRVAAGEIAAVRRRKQELTPEALEKRTNYLYWWLLVVIFFEYARPAAYFAPLRVLPLNSLLPLSLLLVSLFAAGLRPWAKIFEDSLSKWLFIFVGAVLMSMAWASVKM